jgi:hypothetical protein
MLPATTKGVSDMALKYDYTTPYPGSTSGVRGVSYVPDRDKWDAKISYNGRRVRLGRFATKEEAAAAYAVAAEEIRKRLESDPNFRRPQTMEQRIQSLFD